MSHQNGMLRLSNGKGNAPLVLEWPWETPQDRGDPLDW